MAKRLRGRHVVQPLLDALYARHGLGATASATVRTSESHPLQIGTIILRGGGRLGVTFCPGKKQTGAMTGQWHRDLDLDLAAIRAWGAEHLVTLIEAHEFQELGVEALPQRAAAHDLIWHHAPIIDGSIPDAAFEQTWAELGPTLRDALVRSGALAVHCKGGLGRAGTTAARLLLELRECTTATDAIARVRAARRGAIETVVQECFLESLSLQLEDGFVQT